MAQRVPLILAYHAVDPEWRSPLAITPASLADQAALLSSRGYVGLTLSEAERRRKDGTLPARSVVFTFDDGYESTLAAVPVLGEFGYPGTVFVVTRHVDERAPFMWFGVEHEPPQRMVSMDWTALRRLADEGWEIGSHTVNHALLPGIDDEQLRAELAHSQVRIAESIGGCSAVAYPYGQADGRVAAAARDAGYQVGVMLTGAVVADEPLRRPRVGMFTHDTGRRLRAKLSRPALAARRSGAARAVRRVRPGRKWLPSGGTAW